MDSITQNIENENKNTKRYLPHDMQTKIHAVEIVEIQNIHVESITYQDILYGDGIRNMMELQKVLQIKAISQ